MSNQITTEELIQRVAESNDIATKTAGRRIIKLFVSTIIDEIAAGNTVRIAGLGKFTKSLKPARTYRNPANGASIAKPSKHVPKFKAFNSFKTIIAGN